MRICLLLLFLPLIACRPSQSKVPEDVLHDTVMRNLIIEFSLADAASMINSSENQVPAFRPELFYEAALTKQGTDREAIIRSLEFYQKHPKLLEKIYESAITELNQRQIKNK